MWAQNNVLAVIRSSLHHDLAMQHADEKTVLGDFNNTSFDYYGTVSNFYKKGKQFFVKTDGPDGKLTEYPIAYTFGVQPLQQYLVEFSGGHIVLPANLHNGSACGMPVAGVMSQRSMLSWVVGWPISICPPPT